MSVSNYISSATRLFLVLLLLFPLFSFAQLSDGTPDFIKNIKSRADFDNLSSEQQLQANQYFSDMVTSPKVVANVNLQNAVFKNELPGQFDIHFELANGEGVQTGIRYSASLIRETDHGQVVVDKKVYSETLTLKENNTIEKDIIYTAPSGLNGKYKLIIESSTEGGLPLGVFVLGDVVLAPVAKGLEILNETCFVQVAGEKNSPHYTLTEGVDIDASEKLQLACTVVNYTSSAVFVKPTFETHFRSVYGEIVADQNGSTDTVTLEPNEKKTVLITLPQALMPQAYDIRVTLGNSDIESNAVILHYVLTGTSATIKNAILDQSAYSIDDIARLTFVWSPSADGFPNSRHGNNSPTGVALDVSIVSNGQACIEPETLPLNINSTKSEISLPIIADCTQPVLALSIKDVNGEVLDQAEFIVAEPTIVPVAAPVAPESNNKLIVITLTLIIAAIMIYFYSKKHGNEDVSALNRHHDNIVLKSLIFTVMMTGSLFGGIEKAEAVSWTEFWFDHTANLNKTTFMPGETMDLTTTTYYSMCTNDTEPYQVSRNIFKNASPFNSTFSGGQWQVYIDGIAYGNVLNSVLTHHPAPTAPGNYITSYAHYTGSESYSYFDAKIFITVLNSCVANSGQACTQTNACGVSSSGTYNCAGTCSVSAPALPTNYGDICQSTANTCGMTNTGTLSCSGGCSATAPADSLCTATVANIGATNCVIAANNNSCLSNLTWSSTGVTSPVVRHNGTSFSSAANNLTGTTRALSYGANTFKFFNGTTELASDVVTASCALGTAWNGSICAITASATAVVNADDCTIGAGLSSCSAPITWNSGDVSSPSIRQNGIQFSTTGASTVSRSLTYGSNTFTFYNGSTLLDSDTGTASCASNSVWNGSVCAAPLVRTANIDSADCTIALGGNSCVVLLDWDSTGVITPIMRQNGVQFSTLPNSVGTPRTLNYGVYNFSFYDGADFLDTEFVDTKCEVGTAWNGSICAITASATAVVNADDCTIGAGLSSCSAPITWNSGDVSSPSIRQNGIQFSTTGASTVSRSLTYGSNTFTFYNGSTLLDSDTGTASCASNSVWNGSVCVQDITATINAPDCIITGTTGTCTSVVTWDSNITGSPSVHQNGVPFSTDSSNPGGEVRTLTFGPNVFKIYDGSTEIVTDVATAGCATESLWVGSSCVALPVISIEANPLMVRYNTKANVTIKIEANYNMSCQLFGMADTHLDHFASASQVTYHILTKALTSDQIVRIECTSEVDPSVTGDAEVRVRVVPKNEEI